MRTPFHVPEDDIILKIKLFDGLNAAYSHAGLYNFPLTRIESNDYYESDLPTLIL